MPIPPIAGLRALAVYQDADGSVWAVDGSTGSGYQISHGPPMPAGVPEAPADGAQYVRQDGNWVAIKPPPQPFAPTLSSITPSSVPAGSLDTVITFTGTGFQSAMQPCFGDQLMSWYSPMVSPVFVSATEFQATLGANLLSNPTSFFLWIQNTSGPDSNNLEFDVT